MQTVAGLMLAGGSGLVMVAVGLDNVLFWTFVLFLLSFTSIIGVTVGSIAPAAFVPLQFPTLWQALAIFGGIQLVAFVIGKLIYPRMQAETQNISPVATAVARLLVLPVGHAGPGHLSPAYPDLGPPPQISIRPTVVTARPTPIGRGGLRSP